MHLIGRLILTLLVIITHLQGWCQSVNPTVSRLKLDRVTSRLNNSRWYGKAFASRESKQMNNQEYKVSTWFDASFIAYQPRNAHSSSKAITDTLTQLVVSQWLSISHIPIMPGRYNLADSTTRQQLQIKVQYDLLDGGDAISDSYYLSDSPDNWIQILAYDPKREIITGAFNLRLTSKSGKIADFKNGIFKVRTVYELK